VKSPFSTPQDTDEAYRQISPEEAKKLIDGGRCRSSTVREPWEYNAGHVPGRVWVAAEIRSCASRRNYGDRR